MIPSQVLVPFAFCLSVSVAVSPKVIIVGAGAAGIAAGSKLMDNGIRDIVLLEAESRIGGRIHSAVFDDQLIDLGAEWVYGDKRNVVFDMAYKFGYLESTPYDNLTLDQLEFYDVNRTKLSTEDIAILIAIMYQVLEKDADELENFDGSFADFLTDKLENIIIANYSHLIVEEYVQPTINWFNKELNYVFGADMFDEVSAKGLVAFDKDDENDNYYHWGGKGFKTILDIMMRKLPEPMKNYKMEEKIQLNKEVSKISWKNVDKMVSVECSDGSTYTGDHVIVTVSLGVLQQNQKSMFNPALPKEKIFAINKMNFGVNEKLVIRYPSAWWGNDSQGINIFIDDEDEDDLLVSFSESQRNVEWMKAIYQFLPTSFERNTLSTFITGRYGKLLNEIPDDEVKEAFASFIKYFLENQYDIPEPIGFIRSKWYSNPHFLGASSYRSVQTEMANVTGIDLAKPLRHDGKEVVLFAGEATSVDHQGSVHGAIETGWREARRIVNIYK